VDHGERVATDTTPGRLDNALHRRSRDRGIYCISTVRQHIERCPRCDHMAGGDCTATPVGDDGPG
jgi:hypothetical protein